MEFRKMVTITLYAKQKKRHRCTEHTFELILVLKASKCINIQKSSGPKAFIWTKKIIDLFY